MMKFLTGFWFISVMLTALVWFQWPDQRVAVVVCDVGQGDAIVFLQGFSQLVVDTGSPDKAVLTCLGNLLPFWDRQIEVVMITHDHADHIGGLAELLNHYRIGYVVTTAEAQAAVEKIVGAASEVMIVGQGDWWQLGLITGEVVWPPKRLETDGTAIEVRDKNHYSLVWRMSYGNYSVWMAGDSDCKAEEMMVRQGVVKATTYLKVGHHGSKTSSCEPFLSILQPHQAWISAGEGNRFDHPHQKVLVSLEERGIEWRRTDKEGQIKVVFD
jgi:competence protein ComEC